MSITFGDYLIDSGYYDPPYEEEIPVSNDIVDRLEDRAISYDQSGPSAQHTAVLLREARFEIMRLRSDLDRLASQLSSQTRGTP